MFCRFRWIKLSLPGKWQRINLFFWKCPTASKSNFLQVLQLLGCGATTAVVSMSLSDPGLRKKCGSKWRRNWILLIEKGLFSFPHGDNKPCGSLKCGLCWPSTFTAKSLLWSELRGCIKLVTQHIQKSILSFFWGFVLFSEKLLTSLVVGRRRQDCQSDTVCCRWLQVKRTLRAVALRALEATN